MKASEYRPLIGESGPAAGPLLRQLTTHLRENGPELRAEWVRRILNNRLLRDSSPEDIAAVASDLYECYVSSLEAGGLDGLRGFLSSLPERLGRRGVPRHEVRWLVYLLRDVLGRSLFQSFRQAGFQDEDVRAGAPVRPGRGRSSAERPATDRTFPATFALYS